MASMGQRLRAVDDDLGAVRATVAEMGGLAEAAIDGSIEALTRRDLPRAAAIVEADRRIDALQAEIERRIVRLLSHRTPAEDDLREMLAALKIAGVLERIADYAKNIAKRVPLLQEARAIGPMSILPAMSSAVAEMVHDVLDAYVARDAAAAQELCRRDSRVDDLYSSLFQALLAYMAENPDMIGAATHLLFVAKNLERIGDHATNAAEMIHFAATGEQITDRARGLDPLGGAGA